MYSTKLFCVLFLYCAFSINVFAETQPSNAPAVQETNYNKGKNNLLQGFTPISKEAIDELRLNGTLRNLYASELYQNHLFVYHQWLQFWKKWVDTYRKEINELPDIAYENSSLSQGTPDLEPRLNEEDASTNVTVSIETEVTSGSVPQPGVDKIYPIYSDDNEILFWISEKRLNQYLNQSFQTPTTIMVNPNFQINTIVSNNTNATSGIVSPDIFSNNSNDFVIFPALITSVVSNTTNTTTYFASTSQNTSDSDAPIRFLNNPTLTFNVVRNPDENDTELPEVTTQQTPISITVTPVTVSPTLTSLPVTVKPVNNGTDIDFTTPKLTTLPVIITPDPQINHTPCPVYDDNCTEDNHFTGAPFTAIYTTQESILPYTEIIDLNSTGDHIDHEASIDDSNWMFDAEDLFNFNCTGDECDNGTTGIEEYNATNPKYVENVTSIPIGQISVEQLLNSSNFNNNDWVVESDFFNATDEICYCDEMEDELEFDDFDTEDLSINDTDLNRIFANKDDSEGTVFETPKSIVNFAACLSENRDNIKSFSDPSNSEDDKFKKSLAPILEALESASPDPLKAADIPEQFQEQSTFHSYDQCQFDKITHNVSLLEPVDPNIISIAEANLDKPPHETESHGIEEQNSTLYEQIHNVNFDLLDDSDTLAEDSDLFKERSDFRKPNNDASCENISKDNRLVINQTCIATPESPEALYHRHSNELIEMREIMKKLRLIGLNFLDMGHLMLNGNAKCPILPKNPEEFHNHKTIYPAETHE